MKDHVQISQFHAFRVSRDQVMDLETWFKIDTNFSNVETASPKTKREWALQLASFKCIAHAAELQGVGSFQ